jgi:hypothetical protein
LPAGGKAPIFSAEAPPTVGKSALPDAAPAGASRKGGLPDEGPAAPPASPFPILPLSSASRRRAFSSVRSGDLCKETISSPSRVRAASTTPTAFLSASGRVSKTRSAC